VFSFRVDFVEVDDIPYRSGVILEAYFLVSPSIFITLLILNVANTRATRKTTPAP
jgi:hypothetical protein